jgi:hypothetical protein
MISWFYSRSRRTAFIRSGRAAGLLGELERQLVVLVGVGTDELIATGFMQPRNFSSDVVCGVTLRRQQSCKTIP